MGTVQSGFDLPERKLANNLGTDYFYLHFRLLLLSVLMLDFLNKIDFREHKSKYSSTSRSPSDQN